MLVVLMLVFIPFHSIYKLNKRLNYSDTYLKIGETVRQNTARTDLIVLEDRSASPKLFYYSRRKGWGHTVSEKISPLLLDDYIKRGATHYVMANFDPQKSNPALYSFLKSNHQLLIQEENVSLFKLTKH